jgi:hypothetical protein
VIFFSFVVQYIVSGFDHPNNIIVEIKCINVRRNTAVFSNC